METISETKDQLLSSKDYAIFYLRELGFSVFVLRSEPPKDRKKPVTSWEPYQHAHPTLAQIEKWFNENPNYNIAAATGNISNNMIAVDIDGPTAEKRIAEKRLEMSPNLRTAIDNTMMNITGSGGKHIIFRLEEPTAISQKVIWKNNEAHSQILLQGNDHYVVMPPSKHPNGKLYLWNGKTPELLTSGELKEFIRLLAADPETVEDIPLTQKRISDNDNNKTALQYSPKEEVINEISNVTVAPEEILQELYDLVKPYYTPGERNDLIFNLSGMMRKDGGFTLGDCKALVTRLCENSGFADEDLEGSLGKVENTYKKPLGELKGRSGLYEILVSNMDTIDTDNDEFKARREAYDKLLDVISKNNKKNKDEKLIDGCIIMEPIDLDSRFYTTVFSKDGYFDRGTNSTRPIRMIRQLQIRYDEKLRKDVIESKQVILNAAPTPPIEVIRDPLFEQVKYKIVFEYVGSGNIVKQEIVGPYTKEELRAYLTSETSWVFKEHLLADAINHVIAGFTRKRNMAIFRTETETEGLIWPHDENKLVPSQRTLYKPTSEECQECVQVINELQEKFYVPTTKNPFERKRFSHFVKIGLVSIVDFARRQNGAVGTHGIIPRQDLSGWPNSGKSYGYAGLALRMYRLPLHGSSKYVIGSGSVETEARFIEQTKWTTMPVIFDDADFLTYWEGDNKAKRILPLIKNAVEMTNPRDILTHDGKRKNLPSCAYTMFTHNSGLITEDGFIRRSTGHEFTKNDEKTPEQRAQYEAFFDKHDHTFGFLGDFVIWYYLEHPEVLFNDWLSMAKTILQAFYEHAGFTKEEEIPKWLLYEVVESATSQEALAEDRASGIITTLHDLTLNQGWPRIKMEGARWIATNLRHTLNNTKDLDSIVGADKEAIDDVLITATIEEKIQAMIALNTLPNFRWHPEKEVCITAGIVGELRKRA